MAKAKRELEKARREYEKVAANRGAAANSPSDPDDSNPLK
jgi:hypothetical protein